MDNPIKVAVVRTDRRRGGVAEALSLISDDLRLRVDKDPQPVVIPNLDDPRRPWTCTHRDTLSATADALLAAGASAITVVAEQGDRGRDSQVPPDRLGYHAELWNRPARFVQLQPGTEDGTWRKVPWIGGQGQARSQRVPGWVASSRCRVVLGVAKAHGVFRVGLGLANLARLVHPDDRMLPRWECDLADRRLPAGEWAAGLLGSWRGPFLRAWLEMRTIAGGMRLTGSERRRLEAVERASEGLVGLAGCLMPGVSLIDGFEAAEGDAPRHGRRARLRTIVAGTDAVAVDAVAAAAMGFEPLEIAYLRQAHALGLGTANLGAITIVGDALAPARKFLRHSSDRLLRLAGTTSGAKMPRPHFGPAGARRSTRTKT